MKKLNINRYRILLLKCISKNYVTINGGEKTARESSRNDS